MILQRDIQDDIKDYGFKSRTILFDSNSRLSHIWASSWFQLYSKEYLKCFRNTLSLIAPNSQNSKVLNLANAFMKKFHKCSNRSNVNHIFMKCHSNDNNEY